MKFEHMHHFFLMFLYHFFLLFLTGVLLSQQLLYSLCLQLGLDYLISPSFFCFLMRLFLSDVMDWVIQSGKSDQELVY